MDAITDMDQFDEKQSYRPDLTAIQKTNKKISVRTKLGDMTQDQNSLDMSNRQTLDVAGQMFFWDASEDPNVVIRQSRIEGFVYSIFTSEDGVHPDVYSYIVRFFIIHMSPRFKKELVDKMYLDHGSGVYRFKP